MKIVTVSFATTDNQRMFGLMVAPGKEREASLTVGISRASIIEYLLEKMEKDPAARHIAFERMEIKKIPIRLQMFLSGQLPAVLLPEPLLSLAQQKGGQVLVTDESLAMPLTVLCLHKNRLPEQGAFLRAYAQAVANINAHPEQYRELMARTCRIPKPLVADFPVYAYPVPRQPTAQEIRPVQEWMLAKGLLRTSLSYEELVP